MIQEWHHTTEAGITGPSGFCAGTARAGLKTAGDDVAVILSDRSAAAAGMFTTNCVRAACVDLSARVAAAGRGRAIAVNAGNANACTGSQGIADTERVAHVASGALGVPQAEVLVASTGVIGRPLAVPLLEAGIPAAAAAIGRGPDVDVRVAHAIMTTDTCVKQASAVVTSSEWQGEIRIGAVCKGAGMIAPRLGPPHATMLMFVTCDAGVTAGDLQAALAGACTTTLNRVTVDGDTSTNDMVVALANGASGAEVSGQAACRDLTDALERVLGGLARAIARDGEGATKLVSVTVAGAATEADADRIARAIAESPLVKTALHGGDPNWGRVMAAAGRAGVTLRQADCSVHLGEVCVCRHGAAADYDTQAAEAVLAADEVAITVQVGSGPASVTWWTCDFSYDYVRINAEYHT